jgi:hypothetical protein
LLDAPPVHKRLARPRTRDKPVKHHDKTTHKSHAKHKQASSRETNTKASEQKKQMMFPQRENIASQSIPNNVRVVRRM